MKYGVFWLYVVCVFLGCMGQAYVITARQDCYELTISHCSLTPLHRPLLLLRHLFHTHVGLGFSIAF